MFFDAGAAMVGRYMAGYLLRFGGVVKEESLEQKGK